MSTGLYFRTFFPQLRCIYSISDQCSQVFSGGNTGGILARNSLAFNDQCSHHMETSQLIYRVNQLTGFYMGTLFVKRLTHAQF